MKVFTGTVSYEVESFDTYTFKVFLSEEEVIRITELQAKVKALKVYEIVYFDSCIDVWAEGSESEITVDGVTLHVQEDYIRVTGIQKWDSHTFSTGLFSLDQMEEE